MIERLIAVFDIGHGLFARRKLFYPAVACGVVESDVLLSVAIVASIALVVRIAAIVCDVSEDFCENLLRSFAFVNHSA